MYETGSIVPTEPLPDWLRCSRMIHGQKTLPALQAVCSQTTAHSKAGEIDQESNRSRDARGGPRARHGRVARTTGSPGGQGAGVPSQRRARTPEARVETEGRAPAANQRVQGDARDHEEARRKGAPTKGRGRGTCAESRGWSTAGLRGGGLVVRVSDPVLRGR